MVVMLWNENRIHNQAKNPAPLKVMQEKKGLKNRKKCARNELYYKFLITARQSTTHELMN